MRTLYGKKDTVSRRKLCAYEENSVSGRNPVVRVEILREKKKKCQEGNCARKGTPLSKKKLLCQRDNPVPGYGTYWGEHPVSWTKNPVKSGTVLLSSPRPRNKIRTTAFSVDVIYSPGKITMINP